MIFSPEKFSCPTGKQTTKSVHQTAKFTSFSLADMTFFAHCILLVRRVWYAYIYTVTQTRLCAIGDYLSVSYQSGTVQSFIPTCIYLVRLRCIQHCLDQDPFKTSTVFETQTSFNLKNTSCLLNLSNKIVTLKYMSFILRNRKHVPCNYKVIETGVKVWRNENCKPFHSFFKFSLTSMSVSMAP